MPPVPPPLAAPLDLPRQDPKPTGSPPKAIELHSPGEPTGAAAPSGHEPRCSVVRNALGVDEWPCTAPVDTLFADNRTWSQVGESLVVEGRLSFLVFGHVVHCEWGVVSCEAWPLPNTHIFQPASCTRLLSSLKTVPAPSAPSQSSPHTAAWLRQYMLRPE